MRIRVDCAIARSLLFPHQQATTKALTAQRGANWGPLKTYRKSTISKSIAVIASFAIASLPSASTPSPDRPRCTREKFKVVRQRILISLLDLARPVGMSTLVDTYTSCSFGRPCHCVLGDVQAVVFSAETALLC